jgi:hypothetical protein
VKQDPTSLSPPDMIFTNDTKWYFLPTSELDLPHLYYS